MVSRRHGRADHHGLMVMERLAVAFCMGWPESVTIKVKLDVPVWVGVPEIAPLLVFRERPCGSEPLVMEKV